MTMGCCTPLTDAERAKLQAYLDAAEAAYHGLMIGGAVAAFTDQNGEKVEYRAGNRLSLIGYINQLRARLGLPPMCGLVAGPLGVFL